MAAEALVSASTGVMNSVLEKLATLMGDEYTKHRSMQREVAFLKDELGSMDAVLKKLENMEEEIDPQTREWKNQVMDMAFHIEDCIDDFMHESGEDSSRPDVGFVGKIAHYINMLRARHQFANQIQQLKAWVKDVSERRKRYKLDECASSSSYVSVDPRMPALYVEVANLVGMEGPKEDLINLLTDQKAASVQPLRVVSIVGFGGLGKTTLAIQVYHELGGQYDCKVFVSISQRPNMMKLLGRIIKKLKMPQATHTDEVQDLIEYIREYLREKRYFFVIDDIWDESVWGIIRCVFPKNQQGSKVIVTTRIEMVAKATCNYQHEFVYKMSPLDDQNSRKLFFSRVGQVDLQPLEEISIEILKKCGGLPLAIVSIASLLVSQTTRSVTQWKYVCNSLSSNLRTNPTLEGMRQVLNLSYNNLPHRLKTCLLYIAMYPEDYIIMKRNLLREWVAEGFIPKVQGQDADMVAESYFNELVNRSMIQPTKIWYDGQVIECKVHDMILDLIRLKSEEEKFLSVADDLQGITAALRSKVRRLSLQLDYGANEGTIEASLSMPHIRSLGIFGKFCFKFSMYELKSIRVLNVDCQGAGMADRIDLTPICKLFHLRYLSIISHKEDMPTLILPRLIGDLKHLETLKLDIHITTSMPSDIVDLPCLLHLYVPIGTRLPDGIRRMKALRTLRYFDVHMNSVDDLIGLSELTNLRSLYFCSDHDKQTTSQHGISMGIFWCSVSKLMRCNLRNFRSGSKIFSPQCVELASLITSNTERNLEELHVAATWTFSRVPIWIGQHQKLCMLGITVEKLMQEDIDLLAGLPNLLYLWLWIRKSPGKRIIIGGGAVTFRVLKYLRITCFTPCLTFMAWAMPELQNLVLEIHEQGVEHLGPSAIKGVEHLPNLRQVDVGICFERADTESQRRAADAEAILTNALSVSSGHPSIKMRLEDGMKYFKLSCASSDGGDEVARQPNDAVDGSAEAATHAPSTTADG
ncbi:disease resistance protein RGA5-like [Triticum dicoccoides]|uniref:disease resistance protein RGA5-like n=1 Tax=Triticum dicoccoides TaxID=85692 RepID=UPI000E7AFA5B|nr:disease resistance protein RGA5-like [Triticum dicoccoides]